MKKLTYTGANNRFAALLEDDETKHNQPLHTTAARNHTNAPSTDTNVPSTDTTCPVCMDDVEQDKVFTTRCGCSMCRDCFREHITIILSTSTRKTWPFSCPVCEATLHPLDIRGGCSRKVRRKVDKTSLRAVALKDKSMWKCPIGQCQYFGMLDAGQGQPRRLKCPVQCPACKQTSCSGCSLPFRLCRCLQPHVPAANVSTANLRGCPNCGAPSEKVSGCSHVSCPVCFRAWDWSAGAVVTEGTTELRGHGRSLKEWFRVLLFTSLTLGCAWLVPTMVERREWVHALGAAIGVFFGTAQALLRSKDMLPVHTLILGTFALGGTSIHLAGVFGLVPALQWVLTSIVQRVGWQWLPTLTTGITLCAKLAVKGVAVVAYFTCAGFTIVDSIAPPFRRLRNWVGF